MSEKLSPEIWNGLAPDVRSRLLRRRKSLAEADERRRKMDDEKRRAAAEFENRAEEETIWREIMDGLHPYAGFRPARPKLKKR